MTSLRRRDPRTASWLRAHAGRAMRAAFGTPKALGSALGVSDRHARRICEDGGTIGHALEVVASAPRPEHLIAAAMIAARREGIARMTASELEREYQAARKAAASVTARMLEATVAADELSEAQRLFVLAEIGDEMAQAGVRLAAAARLRQDRR